MSARRRRIWPSVTAGVLAAVVGLVWLLLHYGLQAPRSHLVWFDRTGKQLSEVGEPVTQWDLELSPDGRRAAINIVDPDYLQGLHLSTWAGEHIWIYDLETGRRSRLTTSDARQSALNWSPDGTQVIFNMGRDLRLDLYRKALNDIGPAEPLVVDGSNKWPMGWSADGRLLLFVVATTGPTQGDLWVLPLDGDRKPYAVLQTQASEHQGRLSPDGRWIAYASTASGRDEVYVAPLSGAPTVPISMGGAGQPRWRRDGRELFYLMEDGTIMSAEVNGEGSDFRVGTKQALFRVRALRVRYPYDVTADGQRFLVNVGLE